MLSNILVGLITGALSSAVVAYIFYRIGRRDAILQGHLSTLSVALERCDPTQKSPGRRGDDGLEPTAHMLGCMIRVLDRDNFSDVASRLRPISEEMEALVVKFEQFDEAHKIRKKADWQAALSTIHADS
jgi:hypothetical protein